MDTSRLDAIQTRWEANDYGSDSDAEDVLDLVAEVRWLRQAIDEIADDNSPSDAQYGAYLVADEWRR